MKRPECIWAYLTLLVITRYNLDMTDLARNYYSEMAHRAHSTEALPPILSGEAVRLIPENTTYSLTRANPNHDQAAGDLFREISAQVGAFTMVCATQGGTLPRVPYGPVRHAQKILHKLGTPPPTTGSLTNLTIEAVSPHEIEPQYRGNLIHKGWDRKLDVPEQPGHAVLMISGLYHQNNRFRYHMGKMILITASPQEELYRLTSEPFVRTTRNSPTQARLAALLEKQVIQRLDPQLELAEES